MLAGSSTKLMAAEIDHVEARVEDKENPSLPASLFTPPCGPFLASARQMPYSASGAGVAQLAEQLIRNQQVLGSSPSTGSSFVNY